ncbi:MAG: Shikimate kinase [Parcubacteria bacterium OLB19]|nr:MAG: Shikimate kinase [Parcubacteria bacterium OLB19]
MNNLDNLTQAILQTRKTLFIMCGLPYAGKSHIAKQLRSETSISYISIDDIFHAKGFDWDTDKLPNEEGWQQIFTESYESTRQLLMSGNNVLYDSTNQTKESRDKLRNIANSVGADTYVVYVNAPISTIWQRWEENNSNHQRSVVSRDLVQTTIDMFEEPSEEEKVFVVNN